MSEEWMKLKDVPPGSLVNSKVLQSAVVVLGFVEGVCLRGYVGVDFRGIYFDRPIIAARPGNELCRIITSREELEDLQRPVVNGVYLSTR